MDKTQAFLGAHAVLIVDRNTVPRAHLQRIVIELGAAAGAVHLARDATEASTMIERHSPRTVICDDSIGLEAVMEVARAQRKRVPALAEQVFFLVSGNTSQAAIGRAAEEEIDGFILKPFSKAEFVRIFRWICQEKLNPTEYQRELNLGRDRLFAGELDAAIAHFERAKGLSPDPAMAFFYIGQAQKMRRELGEAKGAFQSGMIANQVHCKSLLGLFDVLLGESKTEEAYEVLRRIVALFPANPARLSTAVNLAVKTGNFRDIENYYDFFAALESGSRTPELKNHMSSALAVNGKYHLIKSAPDAALKSFERAIVSGDGQQKFIDYVLKTLLQYGLYEEATAFALKHAA